MEVDDELVWTRDLKVQNENNLGELREALASINSFKTLDDIRSIVNLRENLAATRFFIQEETNLHYAEIRRIAQHIRKLWFLKGTESDELNQMYSEFLGELIDDNLNDILKEEDDLQQTHNQVRRCVFLIALFSHYYDDPQIYGICKYDKLFLSKLMSRLTKQTQRMIGQNDVEPENYYRLIYLLDKMMANWLDTFRQETQYDKELLFEVRNHLILLSDACKDHYKLVSLALCTIIGNIRQIEAILEAMSEAD